MRKLPTPIIKLFKDDSPEMDRMLKARAYLFHDRLKWDVSVDRNGHEKDQYDTPDATYLILEDHLDNHVASCRMIPLTRPNMTCEAFPGLFDRSMIDDPSACVECTRFCVTGSFAHSERDMSEQLFIEGAHWLKTTSYSSLIAVFYPAMLRVYKRAGWSPRMINLQDGLIVGQWLLSDYSG